MTQQPTYQDYLDGTAQVLGESQRHEKPYFVAFRGKKLIVHPNVFSPRYFHDSFFFAKKMPIIPGQSLLEIGPGTGIVAVNAALSGASKVVAIDINWNAVRNTRENAQRYGVAGKITAQLGDVYTPSYARFKFEERFDTIFWNVPFGHLEGQHNLTDLEKAVFDPNYAKIKEFIRDAPDHLNPHGHLYIGFSSTLGMPHLLEQILADAGFSHRIIARKKSVEKYPVLFELYEAALKPA